MMLPYPVACQILEMMTIQRKKRVSPRIAASSATMPSFCATTLKMPLTEVKSLTIPHTTTIEMKYGMYIIVEVTRR